jgi:hypothetical protein
LLALVILSALRLTCIAESESVTLRLDAMVEYGGLRIAGGLNSESRLNVESPRSLERPNETGTPAPPVQVRGVACRARPFSPSCTVTLIVHRIPSTP